MRVSVYKDEEGKLSVLVQASLGKGRAPVVLMGITPENVVQKTLTAVNAMRLPKGAKPAQPG